MNIYNHQDKTPAPEGEVEHDEVEAAEKELTGDHEQALPEREALKHPPEGVQQPGVQDQPAKRPASA